MAQEHQSRIDPSHKTEGGETSSHEEPIDRLIMQLYYLQNLSIEETAKAVELSVSQVKYRLAKARSQLRKLRKAKPPGWLVSMLDKERASNEGVPNSEPINASGTVKGDTPDRDVSSLLEDPIVEVLMAVAAAFQDLETGKRWLSTPTPSLGNVTPLSLLSSASGRETIANELGLIQHGMF